MDPSDFIHPEYLPVVTKHIQAVRELQCDQPWFEAVFQSLDSRAISAEVALTTIPFGGKTAVHYVIRDIGERKASECEREKLILELYKALAEVKTLKGFIPICAGCKRIRDDDGYWQQLEQYIEQRSEAEFSHSVCPECIAKLYPDYNRNK